MNPKTDAAVSTLNLRENEIVQLALYIEIAVLKYRIPALIAQGQYLAADVATQSLDDLQKLYEKLEADSEKHSGSIGQQ